MSGDNSNTILNARANKNPPRILVVGDLMWDIDIDVESTRMAAEADGIPVWNAVHQSIRPGGASNVAAMCQAFGAEVTTFGMCDAKEVRSLRYETRAPEYSQWGHRVSEKRRYFRDGKMVARVDSDISAVADFHTVNNLLKYPHETFDAVIVADHGKGMITPQILLAISDLGLPTFIDPVRTTPLMKGHTWVGGVHELEIDVINSASQLIIKRGDKGLEFHGPDYRCVILPSECRKLVDPLGAGDQLIAALACSRCLGSDWTEAVEWANIAAGLQCERKGCIPVTVEEIEARRKEIAQAA